MIPQTITYRGYDVIISESPVADDIKLIKNRLLRVAVVNTSGLDGDTTHNSINDCLAEILRSHPLLEDFDNCIDTQDDIKALVHLFNKGGVCFPLYRIVSHRIVYIMEDLEKDTSEGHEHIGFVYASPSALFAWEDPGCHREIETRSFIINEEFPKYLACLKNPPLDVQIFHQQKSVVDLTHIYNTPSVALDTAKQIILQLIRINGDYECLTTK